MGSKLHSLKWENHSCIVMNRLANLYRRDLLIDCTIYVEGEIIHAHRNLMAAASPYFERLLMAEPNKNCFDITDLKHKDVKAVFDFMYFGSVKLPRDDVLSFIRAAEKFQINISCEGIWSFYEKDAFTQPVPLENSKQTDSLSDDWRSLTGSNKIKQEPQDCVNSEVLPYVTGYVNESMMASFGTDELRGLTESSSCSSDEWIEDSRGALVLPTHVKSPSNVHKGHVSPSRSLVPDPPREGLRSRRNGVEEKNVIPDTRQKSPDSPGTKLLETSRRKSAPFSPRKRLISPSENLESASLRDMMSNNKERENSQNLISPCGETSPGNRRSRSRPSMVESEKSQPEGSPTVCLSESGSCVKPYVCDVCGKMFGVRSSLNLHMLTHSDTRPFVCDICGNGFNDKATLKRHIFTHTGEKQFQCEVCKRSFAKKFTLQRHVYCHMAGSAKPYTCEVCDSRFTNTSSLRRHLLIHFGERPHVCKICGKSFRVAHHLKRHGSSHNSK